MQAKKKNMDFITPKRAAWQMLPDVPDVPENLFGASVRYFTRLLTDAKLQPPPHQILL